MSTKATASSRVKFSNVEGAAELFTLEFMDYLVFLHDKFTHRVHELRTKRAQVLEWALKHGQPPGHLPTSDINTSDWKVDPVPDDLQRPGIEISGPAHVTGMFINALNPGPDGERAEGDLDDDEDSAGHQLIDTVMAAHNRLKATLGTLEFINPDTGKEYRLQSGQIPFFMHRERSMALDEQEVTIDGKPIPASILSTALTLYYTGKAQAERGQGIYFYLPKMESWEECAFWKDFFDASKERLGHLKDAVIKAIPLVESLPAAYQMEEMLYHLGPYGAGLNAARWDFKASIFEYVMTDPNSVWPDRFGVDIKTTPFLSNTFRRLVAICLKHGAVPIGGMATPLPSREDEVNKAAAKAIRTDKEWEAAQGFIRAWVAHIFHMKAAADPFKELIASGWKPTPEMRNPDNYPIKIEVPEGPITVEGTRRNARMLIEYLEAWLSGRGAKGIDSLEGKPGLHPALMEDLATGRMSVAQIAQRLIHSAKDDNTGQKHDFALVKRLLQEEVEDILRIRKSELPANVYTPVETRYRKAYKIAMQWIKNYTELNFRSLGSYTRTQLEEIAASQDAF